MPHSEKEEGDLLHCSLKLKWKWTSPFIHHNILTLKKLRPARKKRIMYFWILFPLGCVLVFMEILRKHLGESPERGEKDKICVVYGNVKEKTLWLVSEVRCYFLQPGAVLAASWHSQETGFQLGPAVQSMCLTWFAQGHPCSKQACPRPASNKHSQTTPAPSWCLPAAGFSGCALLCSALLQEWFVLAHLHLFLHIRDWSMGSPSKHKGVKRQCDFKG